MFILNQNRFRFLMVIILFGTLQSCNQTPKENTENDLASTALSKSYTAKGNEPFWAVTIEEPTIIFQTPDQEVTYPYAAPKEESNIVVFETSTTSDSSNSNIRIALNVSECFDSMSGEAFTYTATVTKDDTTYTGCARAE